MQRRQGQRDKKQVKLEERSFKGGLADSGYSENVVKKIWKWYNPPCSAKASTNPPENTGE